MKNVEIFHIRPSYVLLLFFAFLNVVILFGMSGGEWQNFQKALTQKGGYIGILISYLFVQHGTNSFTLEKDRVVIRYPFRPFFRIYVVPIRTMKKFRFHNIHIGVLGPSVIIYANKKMHFSYNGSKNKIKELMDKLNNLGVETEITKG